MRENELAARLARLRSAQASSATASAGSLQGRLNSLSGGHIPSEGAEEDFNNRLASLVSEGGSNPCSADDLNVRLAGLSTGKGTRNGGVAVAPATDVQTYGVPEVRGC